MFAAINSSYIPAIAALAGSAIGAVATIATTWLTQYAQERAQRLSQSMDRREQLYSEFIREAAKLFTDALTHEGSDPTKFVDLYALVGRLRLFAPSGIVVEAENVMRRIVETYALPNPDLSGPEESWKDDLDVLRSFSDSCRKDLGL